MTNLAPTIINHTYNTSIKVFRTIRNIKSSVLKLNVAEH